MWKNIALAMLIGLCAMLGFRVFDLGVTATYLEDDLARTQREVLVLQEFQRTSCQSLNTARAEVFTTEGMIVINGFGFKCVETPNYGAQLLYIRD